MTKLHTLLSHLTVILALMFLTFLILDQFNPMMNFVDNGISRCLLAALCLCGVGQSVLYWKSKHKQRRRQISGGAILRGGKISMKKTENSVQFI